MNTYEYKQAVENAIQDKNIHEAIRLLRVMLPAGNWSLTNELEAIESDYRRLLQFMLSGAPDPSRPQQISRLVSRIYSLLDLLLRESLIPDHSSLYFNIVRTLRIRRGESLTSLLNEYFSGLEELSAFALAKDTKTESSAKRLKQEDLERQIFDRIWTSTPLPQNDIAAIEGTMSNPDAPESLKTLIISALTMSLLQFFNEQILMLLLRFAAPDNNTMVQTRATVGALFVMARWPRRSNSLEIRNIIEGLRDSGFWQSDIEQIVMQIIRMADIEKISKTMRDEILPQIMKLRPDIEKHIKEIGFDPSDPEMNPEWEEMLERSGLTERLRSLSEMQMEGGDMFYSAFSMLKTYPFFSPMANWFLPFDIDRSEVASALGHDLALGMMISESKAMCASDKYSFVLSIDRLPEAQKQMVLSQLSEANIALSEQALNITDEADWRNVLIVQYIQDLYRFFRLFRRNAEFVDPFASLINPASIPAIKADFAEPEKLRLLGEFYFKHRHMVEAVDIFRLLPPDLAVHQKLGHALQALGLHREAVAELEKAEMLDPSSRWTIKQLARTHKSLGNYAKALEYYQRLEQLEPDTPANALNMGHCNLQLGYLQEALHCYYKAEMLDENNLKPLRPIAWCAFLNGDYATAENYYQKVMSSLTPSPEDYINMGHLALASSDMRAAINYYKLYSPDVDKLAASLQEDYPLLQKAGIDIELIKLILDYIRFENA